MEGRGNGEPAIGINLGTTYSCVAVWKHDWIEIIPNDQGNRITPSYVAFLDEERLIGDGAKNQGPMNPANTIFDAKRLIGRRFSDSKVQEGMKLWPFKVIEGSADTPKIVVSYKGQQKEFFAEEISSMVLGKMKETAEAYLGKAVILKPGYTIIYFIYRVVVKDSKRDKLFGENRLFAKFYSNYNRRDPEEREKFSRQLMTTIGIHRLQKAVGIAVGIRWMQLIRNINI